MTDNQDIGIKRSQSECLPKPSTILSPSPKRTSRISLHLAREVFDFSSSCEENENITASFSAISLTKVKFFSLQADTDSTR